MPSARTVVRPLLVVAACAALAGCGDRGIDVDTVPRVVGRPLLKATLAVSGAGATYVVERIDGRPLTTGGRSTADEGFGVRRGLTVCAVRRYQDLGPDDEDVRLFVARRCR